MAGPLRERRKAKEVRIGTLFIGADRPIAVQSMIKASSDDLKGMIEEALRLKSAGCQIIRLAVKTPRHVENIPALKTECGMPVVADVHFDPALAVLAARGGADKIRINPGNIHKDSQLKEILDSAAGEGVAVRIGVNSGSVREHFDDPERLSGQMVLEASQCERFFRDNGFDELVVSLKAPDVITCVLANKKMASVTDLPLHVGLTAAGPFQEGLIRSSMAMGMLLSEGIGDTIRVSLTEDPVLEVVAARSILQALGLGTFDFTLISCPTCGRACGDIRPVVAEVSGKLRALARKSPDLVALAPKVAIMGCEVNGPGEAKAADVGAAFGMGKAALFVKGQVVRSVDARDVVESLIELIKEQKKRL